MAAAGQETCVIPPRDLLVSGCARDFVVLSHTRDSVVSWCYPTVMYRKRGRTWSQGVTDLTLVRTS